MFGSLPGDGAAPVDCDSALGLGAVTADSTSAVSPDPPLKTINAITTAMISNTIFMSGLRC